MGQEDGQEPKPTPQESGELERKESSQKSSKAANDDDTKWVEESTGAADAHDDSDGPWNANFEPAGIIVLVVMVFMALIMILGFVMSFIAWDLEDLDRADKFHPGLGPLNGRYFTHIRPFHLLSPDEYLTGDDCVTQTKIRGDTLDSWWLCTYNVPYTAVWGAIASGGFAVTAACFLSRSLRGLPKGTDTMSYIGDVVKGLAINVVQENMLTAIVLTAALWFVLYFAIDMPVYENVPAVSISFVFGATISSLVGISGAHVMADGVSRTAAACFSSNTQSLHRGLRVAMTSGSSAGIAVVGATVLGMAACYAIFGNAVCLAGYAFGASLTALVFRVSGGVYCAGTDINASLCSYSKTRDLDAVSPRNPASVLDLAGDLVGGVGAGADLFDTYAGAVAAAAVIGAGEFGQKGVAIPFWCAMITLVVNVFIVLIFPLIANFFVARQSNPSLNDAVSTVRLSHIFAGFISIVVICFCVIGVLQPESDLIQDAEHPYITNGIRDDAQLKPHARILGSMSIAFVASILTQFVITHYTSYEYSPSRKIGRATEYGPGPTVIQGLGLGMHSPTFPSLFLFGILMAGYYLCGHYGVAMAVLAMLISFGVIGASEAFSPVADAAGGVADMADLPENAKSAATQLEACAKVTTALSRSISHSGSFLSCISVSVAYAWLSGMNDINLLAPKVVVGMLIGALMPYIFAAATLTAANSTSQSLFKNVANQFSSNPDLLTNKDSEPEFFNCSSSASRAALARTGPAIFGMLIVPLVVGFTAGNDTLFGFLIGATISGYHLASSSCNTGSSWGAARHWIEIGGFSPNGEDAITRNENLTQCHRAAMCSDAVGDALKDAAGPSVIVLVKMYTRYAFALAPHFTNGWDHWWVACIILGSIAVFGIVGGGIAGALFGGGSAPPAEEIAETEILSPQEEKVDESAVDIASPYEELVRDLEGDQAPGGDTGDMEIDPNRAGESNVNIQPEDGGDMEVDSRNQSALQQPLEPPVVPEEAVLIGAAAQLEKEQEEEEEEEEDEDAKRRRRRAKGIEPPRKVEKGDMDVDTRVALPAYAQQTAVASHTAFDDDIEIEAPQEKSEGEKEPHPLSGHEPNEDNAEMHL